MRKIKLDLDELNVETFDTITSNLMRGTVQGQDESDSTWTDCLGDACGNSGECSVVTPHYTMCDFSCEFYCNATEAVRCSERCGSGTGGTGTGTDPDPSGLDHSCEFAC